MIRSQHQHWITATVWAALFMGISLSVVVVAMSATNTAIDAAPDPMEVGLPEGVLWPDTAMVLWLDVELSSPRAFGAAMKAVADTAQQDQADAARAWMSDAQEQLAAWEASDAALTDAGVRAVCFAASVSGSEVEDVEGQERPSTEMFLINAEPGADLNRAYAAIREQMIQLGAEENDDQLPRPQDIGFDQLDGGWQVARHGRLRGLPPADRAVSADAFVAGLRAESGAAVRFAWVIGDDARQSLREQAVSPNMVFFAGLLRPLTELDAATGGLWVGDQPEARLAMQFGNPQAATQFNSTLNGLVGMVTGLMMLGGQSKDADAAAQQEKVTVMLSMLALDKNESRLSKTFNLSVVRRLAEVGMIFEQPESPVAAPSSP